MTVQTTTPKPAPEKKPAATGAPSAPAPTPTAKPEAAPTAPATLFPVEKAPPPPEPPRGAPLTFEDINDGKLLEKINEAIHKADAHLTEAGDKGKARITIKMDIEAVGFIRNITAKLKMDMPEVSTFSSGVKATSKGGELTFFDEDEARAADREKFEQDRANAQANAAKGKAIADEVVGPKQEKKDPPEAPPPGSTVEAIIAGKPAAPKPGDQTAAAGTVSVVASETTSTGWPVGVTREEYATWRDAQLAKGVSENVNPQEYKRLRDAGLVEQPKPAPAKTEKAPAAKPAKKGTADGVA